MSHIDDDEGQQSQETLLHDGDPDLNSPDLEPPSTPNAQNQTETTDTNEGEGMTIQPDLQMHAVATNRSGSIEEIAATDGTEGVTAQSNLQQTVAVDPNLNVEEPDHATMSHNNHTTAAQQTQQSLSAEDSMIAAKTAARAPRAPRRPPRAARHAAAAAAAAAVDPSSNNAVEPGQINSRNADDNSNNIRPGVVHVQGGGRPNHPAANPPSRTNPARHAAAAAAVDPSSNNAVEPGQINSRNADDNSNNIRPGVVHVQGGGRPNHPAANPPSRTNPAGINPTTTATSTSMGDLTSDTCIVAHLVPESEDESDDAEEQVGELVVAEEVTGKFICGVPRKVFIVLIVLIILVAGNLAIGITFSPIGKKSATEDDIPTSSPSLQTNSTTPRSAPTVDTRPVLEAIKERGFLNCRPDHTEKEIDMGFTVDLCRAITAAIFDDPKFRSYRLQFPYVSFAQQFAALWNRTIDVSTSHTTLTMGRDVYEPSTGKGMAFTTPFFYSGMAFAGIPTFVDCAERRDTLFGECGKLSVCVQAGTTSSILVDKLLPGIEKHELGYDSGLRENLANGTCNVVAAGALEIDEYRPEDVGYEGGYVVGQKLQSNEPLAITTKGDDQEWADFCDWVVQVLIKAEALNITQEIALSDSLWSNVTSSFENNVFETSVFGINHINIFRNVIKAVGNYGEMYERHYEGLTIRGIQGVNTINRGDSGLLYAYPFGPLMVYHNVLDHSLPSTIPPPGPTTGGILESIVSRGYLRCGVIGNQTGFALVQNDLSTGEQPTETDLQNKTLWSGLDIEYCRAIAAAIFQEELSNVDDGILFVEVGTFEEDGYVALNENKIDVFLGGSLVLMTEPNETNTGRGFTFSPPYYYYDTDAHTHDNIGIDSRTGVGRSLVTHNTDPQWSAFVRWTTIAIIYAEGEGITQEAALDMPVVELFGSEFLQMFRYTILTIGNYGEVFSRTLEQPYNVTRFGRNFLNTNGTSQLLPLEFI